MISTYDYLIIGVYLVFILVMGLVFRRMSRNTSDYFRAGGAMPWWITGTSAWIASFSAWTSPVPRERCSKPGRLSWWCSIARSSALAS